MSTITVVTCTRDRPEAFALLEKFISRQTRKPDQWHVYDDGETPVKCTMGQKYIYCPEARRGVSLNNKIRMAFAPGVITSDIVVFAEDDDYLHPEWLETCEKELQNRHLFGEGRAIYYNVKDRWWFEHANLTHASLCSTAIRKELFTVVYNLARGTSPFIDTPLWKITRPAVKYLLDPARRQGERYTVGIKAMPGTIGYSLAHKGRDRDAKDDLELVKLRSLIGNDADLYAPFWPKYEPPMVTKIPVHNETGRERGPRWMKWLGHLVDKPDAVGLEIGTFKGESAEFMCENIFTGEGANYFCVDPFTGSVEHQGVVDCSTLEKEARARLAPFKAAKIIKGYSQDVLTNWKGPTLDAAYIDGGHTSMEALRDGVLAFELLKIGGILFFDDYEWTVYPRPQDCPKLGVDSFLAAYADFIEILPYRGWQVAVRRIK